MYPLNFKHTRTYVRAYVHTYIGTYLLKAFKANSKIFKKQKTTIYKYPKKANLTIYPSKKTIIDPR